MYILKNAWKCITRSKGRNILIGIIVLVIATSSCIGLSIRQAANDAKSDTLEGLSVTATISVDRQSMMNNMIKPDSNGEIPSFDKDSFSELMGNTSSLTLEEYETYKTASTVQDFYYTLSVSLNGNDEVEPVSTSSTDSDSSSSFPGNMMGMMGGFGGMDLGSLNRVSSDFQIIGYSSEDAMSDFIDGNTSITDGTIFEEGTTNYDCVISSELATYNELSVGDVITLANPNEEDETYELNIVGIYTSTSSNENFFSNMGMNSSDPANQIYMSAVALQGMLDANESEMNTTLDGTYVFKDVADYETFSEEVYTLGLDESYTVSSSDLSAYESSLIPLTTLSTMAGYFLVVILVIGAIILIVLNIFNIRERKYEIGVLTAIGMKKKNVALQFLTEIFVVTMLAVTLGIGIGAVSSVPVTNALLESQVTSQSNMSDRIEQNFGRGEMPDMGNMSGSMPSMPGGMGNFGEMFDDFMGSTSEMITEIDSAMNFTVVLQMFGIAILLTLISGGVAVLFVMRYEPLKILANRD